MFSWFKKIFKMQGKKETEPAPAAPIPENPQQTEVPERDVVEEGKVVLPANQTTQTTSKIQSNPKNPSERPEKMCPKCGAPNDDFVNICWLCKERI